MNQLSKSSRTSAATEKPTTFVFQSGQSYAEKDEYVAKALTFDIQAVTFEQGAGFEGQDRWSIRVQAHDDRDEELITLQANEKRDQQLRAAQAFIASSGPIKGTRLKKSGKTFFLENAS